LIGVLATIVISLALGVPLLSLFRDRPQTRLGYVSVALLLGYGLVFFVLLASSEMSIAWTGTSVLLTFSLISSVLVFAGWKHGSWSSNPTDIRPAHLIALGLIAILVTGYALFATVAPPVENDYAAIWGLKARIFWSGGGVDWRFLESDANVASHPGYPLLLPLLIDSAWTLAGRIDDRAIGLFWVTFAVTTIALIREGLAGEGHSRTMASLGAAACAGLAFSPWIGLADGAVMAFGTAAVILIRSSLQQERSVGAIAALLLGFAASTKNEGLTLIVAVAIGLAAAGSVREIRKLWPAMLIVAPWSILRMLHNLPTEFTEGDFFSRLLTRLQQPQHLIAALIEFHPGRFYFWIVVVMTLVWNARRVVRRERFLISVIVMQFAFFVGAYVTTPHDVLWHVRWSWPRIGTQVLPLIGFLVALLLTERIRAAFTARQSSSSPAGAH